MVPRSHVLIGIRPPEAGGAPPAAPSGGAPGAAVPSSAWCPKSPKSPESRSRHISISSRLSDALNFSRLAEQGPYHEPRRDAAPRSPRCQM